MSPGRRWPDQAWSSQVEGFTRQRWPVPFRNTSSSPYGQALVGRGALELCPEDWRSLDAGGRGTLGWRVWGAPRERGLRTLGQRELGGPGCKGLEDPSIELGGQPRKALLPDCGPRCGTCVPLLRASCQLPTLEPATHLGTPWHSRSSSPR